MHVGKQIHEFRTDPETPYEWIKKEQNWLEKANQNIIDRTAELDKRIETELVKSKSSMTEEDIVAAKAEYQTVAKGYKNALKMVVDIPGYDAEDFANVTPLKTLAGGTSGAATGTRRVRLSSLTVNGVPVSVQKTAKDGSVSESFTFTNAAQWIAKDSGKKVQPSELSGACFAEAKTTDISELTSVKFAYTPVESDKNYIVEVVPAKSA